MKGKVSKLLACAMATGLALLISPVFAQQGSSAVTPQRDGVAPRVLHDYVEQEKDYWEYLKKNHPVFKYEKEGRLEGKYTLSDREEEFVEFGGGKAYAEKNNRPVAMTYRLPMESMLDFPNKFVGPKKCGECHPAQYEKWERSRHAKVIRFPDEIEEVGNDLKKGLYGSKASILPEGVYADDVYAIIGTPRTKYGFLDKWLVRGTYHVEGGKLGDVTGKLVPGGNQFSRGWAESITPETAKKIAEWVPGFPTTLEQFGANGSGVWGMTSYGSQNRTGMLFQPGSSYCEVCHSWKFDFKSEKEFFAALGNPKELQKHTISKGISCEECHGAGAHLYGARGAGMPSNCERCHQRFAWNKPEAEKDPKHPFNSYFKSSCPSCGTEGSQMYNSAHYEKGMRCNTCHDPHEVTQNDWKDSYTKTGLKKNCQDCHASQADFMAQGGTHSGNNCTSCHMPNMMSCENFGTIQYPDQAGFDAVRASHIWRIKVDKTAKTLNPPEGQPRTSKTKGWTIAKDKDGKGYLDLMWTCGRTAWSDPNLQQAGGCHSPIQSFLPDELKFKDQSMAYDKVMGWQTPVKEGYAKIQNSLKEIDQALAKSNAPVADKAQVQLLAQQARDIADKIKKDGSWGVHGPAYSKKLVDEGQVFTQQALAVLKKGGQKVASK